MVAFLNVNWKRGRIPGAGTVGAAKEVILMRKLLYAAILAASSLLVLATSVGASNIGPCCG